MDIKTFLKPEWKKVIIPAIFIILFLGLVNMFLSVGLVMDKYACVITLEIRGIKESTKMNNTLPTKQNEALSRLEELSKNMSNELKELVVLPPHLLYPYAVFVTIINPTFPVPCDFALGFGHYEFCQYYMSKKTHDCVSEALPGSNTFTAFEESRTFKSYTTLDMTVVFPNIVFLIAEGYILSCLIVFAYRKARRSRK